MASALNRIQNSLTFLQRRLLLGSEEAARLCIDGNGLQEPPRNAIGKQILVIPNIIDNIAVDKELMLLIQSQRIAIPADLDFHAAIKRAARHIGNGIGISFLQFRNSKSPDPFHHMIGLEAGMRYVMQTGMEQIFRREQKEAQRCAAALRDLGYQVFFGGHQAGTVSMLPREDCEVFAQKMAERGVALRAGLHCAPLAHMSAGTDRTGTLRFSASVFNTEKEIERVLNMM